MIKQRKNRKNEILKRMVSEDAFLESIFFSEVSFLVFGREANLVLGWQVGAKKEGREETLPSLFLSVQEKGRRRRDDTAPLPFSSISSLSSFSPLRKGDGFLHFFFLSYLPRPPALASTATSSPSGRDWPRRGGTQGISWWNWDRTR